MFCLISSALFQTSSDIIGSCNPFATIIFSLDCFLAIVPFLLYSILKAQCIYDSSNIEITSATVVQTVTFKAEIKEIIDENTSNPITSSSYKWFVDGVVQEGTSINSGNLIFTPTTAKTYTITYMFLDGTSYNTISGNYYLTVTAS